MKQWVWIPVLLLLCGCSTPVWETVDDLQPEAAVSRQVQLFELQLQLPEQVQLLAADDAGTLWATADSELEIEQRVFLTTDPDSAIESLTEARQYAEEFDRLYMNHPVCRPFTSPFFDRLSFDSADLLVYGPLKDNLRTDDFRSMVTPQTFPALRDREDFGVIIA